MTPPLLLLEYLEKIELNIDSIDGELSAINRKTIYEVIEDLSSSENGKAGYLRRARLGIICALSSLDFLSVYPVDMEAARNALHNAILTLGGEFDIQELERLNDELLTRSNDLLEQDEPNFSAIYASFACFSSVSVVLYDTNFDCLGIKEKELDPLEWGAEFYASIAHAGGAIWEDGASSYQRRKFWIWYLREAIPSSWNVSQSIST